MHSIHLKPYRFNFFIIFQRYLYLLYEILQKDVEMLENFEIKMRIQQREYVMLWRTIGMKRWMSVMGSFCEKRGHGGGGESDKLLVVIVLRDECQNQSES